MAFKFPMTFNTEANVLQGTREPWSAHSGQHGVVVAIPPEFSGPGGALSPEDLFAQALTNCFLGTFKVLAENSKVMFRKIVVNGRLTVDLDETKQPRMRGFHLVIKLDGPSDETRARRLVDKAISSGFILQSVKTQITFETQAI